jgi:hypothetical protein
VKEEKFTAASNNVPFVKTIGTHLALKVCVFISGPEPQLACPLCAAEPNWSASR